MLFPLLTFVDFCPTFLKGNENHVFPILQTNYNVACSEPLKVRV